jgi:hypothetical protein
MRAGALEHLSDDELRQMRDRVSVRARREIEILLSWRVHTGQHCNRPSYEYVPAWVVVATGDRR